MCTQGEGKGADAVVHVAASLHSLYALPLEPRALACNVVPLPAEEAVVAVAHGRNTHVP